MKRFAALFAELDRQLEKAGVILKRGTMLDATFGATSSVMRLKTRSLSLNNVPQCSFHVLRMLLKRSSFG